MPPTAAAAWTSPNVRVSYRTASPAADSPGATSEHRIVVHASRTTRSFCPDTGRDFIRRAGDIDIIPSNVSGGFTTESSYSAYEIALASHFVDRVAAELGRHPGAGLLETRHMLRDDPICDLARALENDRKIGSPSGPVFAESIGVALVSRLLGFFETRPVQQVRLSATQLKRLTDYIEVNLDQALTIDVLSREAGASSSHLRTCFKAVTGMTLHKYVVHRRLERARDLLVTDSMSICEVALAAGFAHQSHLARWMRRELNITPTGLRRAQRASGRLSGHYGIGRQATA